MRTLIRNVRVFDGVRTIPHADVLISDDRIAEYDRLQSAEDLPVLSRLVRLGLAAGVVRRNRGRLVAVAAFAKRDDVAAHEKVVRSAVEAGLSEVSTARRSASFPIALACELAAVRPSAIPAGGGVGSAPDGPFSDCMASAAIADGIPTSWSSGPGGAMEFAELARQQMPRLYALARQLVDDAAEDLVQECLLKAYRSYPELRDAEAAPAWLTRILVNTARDRYRHRDRRVREDPLPDVDDFSLFRTIASEDPFPYSDSLHLDFLHRFGPEDVWAVLRGMPELYRVPLVLVHMNDIATKQAARMLGIPLGTLLARLHRGRKLFEHDLWAYAVRNGLLREEPVSAAREAL